MTQHVYNASIAAGILLTGVGVGLWSIAAGLAVTGALILAFTVYGAEISRRGKAG